MLWCVQHEQEYRLQLERQRLLQYQQERIRREAALMATQQHMAGGSASSLVQILSEPNSAANSIARASSGTQLQAPWQAAPK